MHRVLHILRRAFGGARRRPFTHAFSVFTLAASFLSFVATLTAAANVDALLSRWLGGAEITLYVREDASNDEIRKLADAVGAVSGVRAVALVTPDKARDDFARSLGALGDMATTLPATSFPTSVEVSLDPRLARDRVARNALADRFAGLGSVAEVEEYDGWFDRLAAASFVARLAAFGLGALSLVVAVLVVAAAVRSSVGARRREIEVMRFIGATDGYVRLPFVIEGAFESLLAMGLALAALSALLGRLESSFGEVLTLVGGGDIVRLGFGSAAALLVAGALAGALGALLTVRRLEEV